MEGGKSVLFFSETNATMVRRIGRLRKMTKIWFVGPMLDRRQYLATK